MTISNESRGRIKQIFEPIALAMGRIGLTPNGLTLIGFAITTIGAVLVGAQAWVIGGLVVFVGGVFDMFDGTLARATGQSSKFGAFMDSTFDKAGEILVFLGCIYALANSNVGSVPVLVAAAAMGAAIMVSYTRAKSEGLGFSAGTGMAAIGVMPREVRLVILSLGLIVTGALAPPILQPPAGETCIESCIQTGGFVLLGALAIIAAGSIITVIQRILHVRSQADSATTSTNR